MRTLIALVALLFAGSGCVSLARNLTPGETPSSTQTVLVGEVDFDPAVYPAGPPVFTPSTHNVFTTYLIGFSDSPRAQVQYDSYSGFDRVALVDPGKPFAIVVPGHPTYLRMLRVNSGYGHEFPNTLVMYYVACMGAVRIPLHSGDRYVYVGHLICDHRHGRGHIVVDPSRVGVVDEIRPRIGAHPLVDRIPRPTLRRKPRGGSGHVRSAKGTRAR